MTQLLAPIGLDVFSFVPSNHDKPYIYIGDISYGPEEANKDRFRVNGIATVELFTGTLNPRGSIIQELTWLDEIKVALQPTKGFVLDIYPYFSMTTWTIENDTGLYVIDQKERVYAAAIQYGFEQEQLYTQVEAYNLVHETQNVLYNGTNVIYLDKTP